MGFNIFRYLVRIFKILYVIITTFKRDIKWLKTIAKLKSTVQKFGEDKLTVAKQFRKLVKKHPNKACIIFENNIWTYQDVLIERRV